MSAPTAQRGARGLATGLVALMAMACARASTDHVGADTDEADTDASVEDTSPVHRPDDPDLLFVVNSSAMVEARTLLSAAAPTMFARLAASSTDWHVGVITTDVDDSAQNGTLQGDVGHAYVDTSTPDAAAAFARIVDGLGDDGSPVGAGLRATARALLMPTPHLQSANAGFVREGDRVVVVVVSDDDDESGGQPTEAAFVAQVGALPGASSVTLSAIVGPDPDGCASTTLHARAGTVYRRVAAELGGHAYSICEAEYAPLLDAIGLEALASPSGSTRGDAP